MSAGVGTFRLNRTAPRRHKQNLDRRPGFCPCYSDLAEPFEMAGVDSGGTSLLAFAGSAALTTAGTSSATGFFRLAALVAIGGADYAGHGHPGNEPSCSRRLRRSQTGQTSRILPSTRLKMIISLTENGFPVAGSVREATLSMPV